MQRAEFIAKLEEALDVDAGTLAPGTDLTQVKEWDSLGVVEFQSLADEELGLQVPPPQITACQTVDQLLDLVGSGLED